MFFVLEVIRERLRFDDLRRKILEVKRRYGAGTLLIEEAPISKGLIQSFEESSINVTKYRCSLSWADFALRGNPPCSLPVSSLLRKLVGVRCKGGSVRLPQRAPWLEDFTAELLAFPGRSRRSSRCLDPGTGLGSVDVESAGEVLPQAVQLK